MTGALYSLVAILAGMGIGYFVGMTVADHSKFVAGLGLVLSVGWFAVSGPWMNNTAVPSLTAAGCGSQFENPELGDLSGPEYRPEYSECVSDNEEELFALSLVGFVAVLGGVGGFQMAKSSQEDD